MVITQPDETDERLDEAAHKLSVARAAVEHEDEEGALAFVNEAMDELRDFVREADAGNENAPMWEIATDDVADYVGCELHDIAFGELGTSATLVFEREDGSLHGLKLAPRENIRVCDIEVRG